MGKVEKKNKEQKAGKKRGWVSAMQNFEAEVNARLWSVSPSFIVPSRAESHRTDPLPEPDSRLFAGNVQRLACHQFTVLILGGGGAAMCYTFSSPAIGKVNPRHLQAGQSWDIKVQREILIYA